MNPDCADLLAALDIDAACCESCHHEASTGLYGLYEATYGDDEYLVCCWMLDRLANRKAGRE